MSSKTVYVDTSRTAINGKKKKPISSLMVREFSK